MLLIEGVLCLLRVCRVCRALGLTGAAAFMAAGWRNTGVHSIPLVSHDIPIVSGRALVRPQGHLKKNPLTDRLIYYTSAQCIGESGGPAGLPGLTESSALHGVRGKPQKSAACQHRAIVLSA